MHTKLEEDSRTFQTQCKKGSYVREFETVWYMILRPIYFVHFKTDLGPFWHGLKAIFSTISNTTYYKTISYVISRQTVSEEFQDRIGKQ